MRKIILALLVLALLYCGAWFVVARGVESAARTVLADATAAGRADHAGLAVGGFPLRFTLDLAAPIFRDGESFWSADGLHLSAPAWAPQRLSATVPPGQRLGLGPLAFRLDSAEEARAHLHLSARPNLPLNEAGLELAAPRLRLEAEPGIDTAGAIAAFAAADGQVLAADALQIRAEGIDGARAVRIAAEALALDLPPGLMAQLPPSVTLPARIEAVRTDATLRLDAPLDRHRRVTAVERADIAAFELTWGPLRLDAAGAVDIRPDGRPEGEIAVGVTGWRALVAMLEASGTIDRRLVLPLTAVLTALSDEAGRASLPLVFREGNMIFGPLPLGPAPVLR